MVSHGSPRNRLTKSEGQALSASDVPTPDDFRKLVERERARAERSPQVFALLIFDLTKESDADRERFVRAITRRIRSIDTAGWYAGGQVGVLLPHTDEAGARKLADELGSGAATGLGPLAYGVHAYPYFWLPDRRNGALERNDAIACGQADKRHDFSTDFESDRQCPLSRAFANQIPWWKRTADVVLAGLSIVLLSPLFLILTVFIRCVSTGPILYCHKRVGQKGQAFTCFKFRSMRTDCGSAIHQTHLEQLIESNRPMQKLNGDPRVFFGGNLIRNLSLDELPQLINVLRGEMSLVGPRPCLPYEADHFLRWHTRRFDTKPGITGLWQVSGKNALPFDDMVRLDIAYGSLTSPVRDMLIIAKTPLVILRQLWRNCPRS